MYSIKELKERIKDEEMSCKDYKKHGLLSMSKDEAKHAFFLKMQLKKRL
jgi:hypothetical protein